MTVETFRQRPPTLKAIQFMGDMAAANMDLQAEGILGEVFEQPPGSGRFGVKYGRQRKVEADGSVTEREMTKRVRIRSGDYIIVRGTSLRVVTRADFEAQWVRVP